MSTYTVCFESKDEILTCKECRFKKDVSNKEYRGEYLCSVYKRFINKEVKKDTKPTWCPLKKL